MPRPSQHPRHVTARPSSPAETSPRCNFFLLSKCLITLDFAHFRAAALVSGVAPALLVHRRPDFGRNPFRMLVSAADATPAAAPASAGSAPAGGVRVSDFLALMGEKGGAKKAGKAKTATATPNRRIEGDTPKPEALPATAAIPEAKPAAIKTKAAAETKADGEAVKAQRSAALPAAILAALTEGAKARTDAEPAVPAALAADEGGKAKPKAARPAERREKPEPAGKGEIAARPSDAPAESARATKPETTPSAPKTAEAPSAPAAAPILPDAEPQTQGLTADAQLREARIPLAAREAAQSGAAAPILAMRVVTKDGVAKSIEIRLDPAELGEVNVKLETGRDGRLKAVLSAERADAFELLKKDGGALEAALREAGIDLGEDAITFTLADSGAGQSQQREAAYGDAETRRTDAERRLAATATEAVIATSWRDGILDISV